MLLNTQEKETRVKFNPEKALIGIRTTGPRKETLSGIFEIPRVRILWIKFTNCVVEMFPSIIGVLLKDR